jgi:hypothetical protein
VVLVFAAGLLNGVRLRRFAATQEENSYKVEQKYNGNPFFVALEMRVKNEP